MAEKSLNNFIKTMPLSVPMSIAAVGTVASVLTGQKQLHTLCGIVWLGTSVLHSWQHSNKMKSDALKVVEKMKIMDFVNIPTSKIDLFIRSVEISSYIPGRVRLYSKTLIGNRSKCDEVLDYLNNYTELDEVQVNEVSGSILIKYTPAVLHGNIELTKVEEYIKNHVRRK
ncbi:HMA2 domain-containing protein [Anaerovibrio sp.]|uniref:HMA2 domain-containing protein n=1 Tax=Anaerovibrio sp. TaxID=1872532 RepID=UPI0034369CC0